MSVIKLTDGDFEKRLLDVQAKARIRCRYTQPVAGTMPYTEDGIRYFVSKHMGIPADHAEHEAVVQRILHSEVGERSEDVPQGGELRHTRVYDVKLFRCSKYGHYIKGHMVKACLKVAASRLGLFVAKRGTKGDVSELGTVEAVGMSRLSDDPREVYLVDEDGKPVDSYFDVVKGTVSGPSGTNSISSHVEFVPPGAIFEVEIRWLPTKLTGEDMANILAAMRNIGISGGRSFDFGQFEILEAEIDCQDKHRRTK